MKAATKGTILVGISAILFSLMSLFVKLCDLSSWEVFFIRGIFQALISAGFAAKRGVYPFGHHSTRKLLCLNGLFGSLRVGLFFYAVKNGNLGDVTSIFFTAPSLTILITAMFFGVPLRMTTAASIILCFIGSILVAKPPLLFEQDEDIEYFTMVVSLFGAIASAAFYVTIPMINKKANDSAIIFYFGIISAIVSIVPMFASGVALPDGLEWFWITMVVITGYLGQVCLNTGLKNAPTSSVLLRNIDVVMAFLYSHFIFHGLVTITSY